MNADKVDGIESDRYRLDQLTEKIIGCAYKASNTLGCGFLEKVYENALAHGMRKSRLRVQQQHGVQVIYDGVVIGEYIADLLVEGTVLVELKASKALDEMSAARSMNYLAATGLQVCLLINFGKPRVEIRRIVRNF